MYKDYIAWLEENSHMLDHLEHHNSRIYQRLGIVIRILNYIASMEPSKRNEELEIIFDEGFSYIYDRANYIKTFINDYFACDFHAFLKYDSLVNYYIYVEDVKDACYRKEIDVALFENTLNELTDEIQTLIDRRDNPNEDILDRFDTVISSVLPINEKIITVPEIFEQIEEELLVQKGQEGEE